MRTIEVFPFALVIMFLAEGGYFNHIKVTSLHFGRHFFGRKRVFRKSTISPEVNWVTGNCQHGSRNNFLGIKISRPTPGESLSVLLWLLILLSDLSISVIFISIYLFLFLIFFGITLIFVTF